MISMGAHNRILVVDDDANLRKTLCAILRVKGYEVEAAYSGPEALKERGRVIEKQHMSATACSRV